jgi:CBS domain containing-hemolysin-like protein
MEVKEVVKPAVVIDENATFVDALAAMDSGKSNTLLVTNERGKLSGEVTVTDLLGAIVPDTLNGDEVMEHFGDDEAFMASIELVKDLPVASFMTSDFTALKLEDNLLTIIATAIAHQRARIPVVDHNDHPIGIISRQGLKRIIQKYLR